MKNVLISVLVAFGVAGCATPTTYLKNPKTGQVVQCGGGTAGSWLGGMVGYSIEKNNDADCVANYNSAGFIPFYPGYDTTRAQTTAPAQTPKPTT